MEHINQLISQYRDPINLNKKEIAQQLFHVMKNDFKKDADHYLILLSDEFFNYKNIDDKEAFILFADEKLKEIGLYARKNYSQDDVSEDENVVLLVLPIEYSNNKEIKNNIFIIEELIKQLYLVFDTSILNENCYSDLHIDENDKIKITLITPYKDASFIFIFDSTYDAISAIFTLISEITPVSKH